MRQAERLAPERGEPLPFAGSHVALVVAHPDDEALGAGSQFRTMRRLSLVYMTDGAPSERDARRHGFASRAAYAAARRQEIEAMLVVAKVPADVHYLSYRDQQLAFAMAAAARRLRDLLAQLNPDLVLTHPYEGGHPDHDATAFAVAAARRMLGHRMPQWEFASYHAGPDGRVSDAFLPGSAEPAIRIEIADPMRQVKRDMLACHASQAAIVEHFPLEAESFRRAPLYDFLLPPHPGRLLYESRRRAWRGTHWRRLARAANADLARPALPTPGILRRVIDSARERAWATWLEY